MKSLKQILSAALVLLMIISCCAVAGVSATDSQVIYFEVPESWENYRSVFCHIWVYDGEALSQWQSKKEKCTNTGTEGLYSYDISKVGGLEDGILYGVIFSTDTGIQTYDAFMGTACIGDTLYCDTDVIYENPEDSSKVCQTTFWREQDPTVYGPIKQITSIGNVVGTALPEGKTDVDLFVDFFVNGRFTSARAFSGQTDQQIIDNLISQLSITKEQAADVIALADMPIAWTPDSIASGDEIPTEPSTGDEATPDECVLGDVDGDGKVNVKDATAIQKYAAGYEITICEVCADADCDGKVNVKDATAIQKYVAGIETGYPIGQ